MDEYDKKYLLEKIREAYDLLEEVLELVDNIDTEDND